MSRARRNSGTAALETALFLPVLFLLLFGTVEIAKITYTYYTIQKMLYGLARSVGTAQGVNFCDDGDPTVTSAKNIAATGTPDASGTPIVANLTPDMIQVRIERVDPNTGDLGVCDCTVTGCDTANGGLAPDFIVVSLPQGYPFAPHIPLIPSDPIPLRPVVRVPYGGT